ncbi:hypothetical protein H0H92_013829, partial [Tricholoma furcatifolium]
SEIVYSASYNGYVGLVPRQTSDTRLGLGPVEPESTITGGTTGSPTPSTTTVPTSTFDTHFTETITSTPKATTSPTSTATTSSPVDAGPSPSTITNTPSSTTTTISPARSLASATSLTSSSLTSNNTVTQQDLSSTSSNSISSTSSPATILPQASGVSSSINDHIPLATIVGATLGSLIFILISAFLIWRKYSKRQSKNELPPVVPLPYHPGHMLSLTAKTALVSPSSPAQALNMEHLREAHKLRASPAAGSEQRHVFIPSQPSSSSDYTPPLPEKTANQTDWSYFAHAALVPSSPAQALNMENQQEAHELRPSPGSEQRRTSVQSSTLPMTQATEELVILRERMLYLETRIYGSSAPPEYS